MGAAVRLEGIGKRYGDVDVLTGVDLEVDEGEFFSMLGPSGSGKTTCLRIVAGLVEPSWGRVLLHGEDVTARPPYQRDVNTVFQDYALFPHMSVGDNVAYGLMVEKVPKAERRRRASEALAMVRLEGYEKRRPTQLSGGQRQRVALARALVKRPRVLLLDEPLGALDLKLREQMQKELKAIQAEVGITFIFVTHDQAEALSMSDRIAVFNEGRIVQVAPPAELYENPADAFVAGFVGTSNLLGPESARKILGREGTFTVRPEKIRLVDIDGPGAGDGECSATGVVTDVSYLGAETRYTVTLDAGDELVVTEQNLATKSTDALAARDRPVRLIWGEQHNRLLPG
ncbi:ABC transporter ATP-binding protein [Sporichthya polymorpha]|uniref:ABC transporter ATP-binding protein n=1 Tax=Sporichthya polymorpha TaxID=35751 RepID=UPI0003740729|nr:ABC transporter ATP-binding protein [Sporichthya polymorpha]